MTSLLKFLFIVIAISANSFAVANLKVNCEGQGPAIYLIGGGPAFSTWNLQPIQKPLADTYRVCRWDMRGVGDNADLKIVSDSSVLSQWLEDMNDVITNEPVLLWGHSWGALQVLLFAKNFPQLDLKLILSNPVDPKLLSMDQIDNKLFQHPEIDHKLTLDEIGTDEEKLHNFRSKIASYFKDGKQGWEYALQFSPEDSNNELNVRIWKEYRNSPLSDIDIKSLSKKIFGVIYCRDDVLQPESQREYQRLIPEDKHHVIRNCGHFPWEENPEDYFKVLMNQLQH